jgi:hypothetical protein
MSEVSIGNASEAEKRSTSTIRHVSNQHPRSRGLRSQASSDVLGAQEYPAPTESITSLATGQLRPQESFSTLKSYYDPTKLPPAISQQTSDSAIRDMALRKGKQPVIRTIPNTYAYAPAPNTLGESNLEEVEPTEPVNGKRRPARLDFSWRLPRPNFSSLQLLSPAKYVEPPTQLSATSEHPPPNYASSVLSKTSASSIAQSSRSGNKLSKMRSADVKSPSKRSAHEHHAAQNRDEVGVFKSNVRRPPRGIKNWFDGLLEEEDEDDLGEGITALPPVAAPARGRDLEVHSKIDQPHTRHTAKSFEPQQLPPSPRHPLSSHPVQKSKEKPTSSTNRHSMKSHKSGNTSRSRSSKLASSNLRESSVISSSDDETGPDESETHFPRVRDSIALSELGETILIGKAQAFEVKPRSKVLGDHTSDRRPSLSSSILSSVTTSSKPSSIGSGAYLAVPPSFQVNKTRHTRQPSSIPEDEDENRRSSSSATPRSNSQSATAFQNESHKLMAVTEEEEALLEMMRRKRAAMAKHSFAEGYRTALQQETKHSSTPPRNRFPNSRSSSGQGPALQRSKRPPSLIDSFPISNSQRSSLILAASLPSPPPTSALPDPPIEPPSKRFSRLSQHTVVSAISATSGNVKRLSQLSSMSAVSIEDRLTTPPTTLSSLDVNVSNQPPKHNHSPTPSSGSQISPLPSPMTPQTRRGSADVNVMIKHSSSARDSGTSSAALNATEQSLIDEVQLHAAIDDKARRHSHRRTASSTAHIILPESEESDEVQRPVTAPLQSPTQKAKNRTSLRINTAACNHESCVDKTSWRQSGFGPLTRCSVSDDVLAAWTELGGWRGFDYHNAPGL